MDVLNKYKHKITRGHSNPMPGHQSRESKNFEKQWFPCDHGSTRYHSKDTQQPRCRSMDERIRKRGVHRHKATSLSRKEAEQNAMSSLRDGDEHIK